MYQLKVIEFARVKWPCAILDFSLHPAFLNNKFFLAKQIYEKNLKMRRKFLSVTDRPSSNRVKFSILNENNTAEIILVVW